MQPSKQLQPQASAPQVFAQQQEPQDVILSLALLGSGGKIEASSLAQVASAGIAALPQLPPPLGMQLSHPSALGALNLGAPPLTSTSSALPLPPPLGMPGQQSLSLSGPLPNVASCGVGLLPLQLSSRLALPSLGGGDDEAVFVNAKQYHGILRRRRARAATEHKLMKNRKVSVGQAGEPAMGCTLMSCV